MWTFVFFGHFCYFSKQISHRVHQLPNYLNDDMVLKNHISAIIFISENSEINASCGVKKLPLTSSVQGFKASGKTLGITRVVTTLLSMVVLSAHRYKDPFPRVPIFPDFPVNQVARLHPFSTPGYSRRKSKIKISVIPCAIYWVCACTVVHVHAVIYYITVK